MTSHSDKVDINGWPVWYEKFGSGSKPLLMIPGAIGTGRSDFYYQVYGEDALNLTKFTIICIELPGWGRSRPPDRIRAKDVFKNDSECCIKLMQSLGYNEFSVLGWSEGARTALVLTWLYPKNIENLILMGIISFPTEVNTRTILQLTSDVDNWNGIVIQNYLRSYKDRKEIQDLWDRHMVFIEDFHKHFPNGICNNNFDPIICPVLIIHGDKDPLVQLEQPLHVLKNIKGAKIKRFPLGSHNLHHKYRKEFKNVVQDFLLNKI